MISEYNYRYDLAGKQISKTDSFGTTYYTYDKAGRMQKVTTPGKTTVYSYDNAGNRVSQNETYTSLQPSGYVDETTGKDIQYILKKSDYTYSSSNTLLKLVERMFDESNTEIARKTSKYVYDNNGNQLRQTASYVLPDNTKLRPASNGTAYGDNIPGTIDKLVEKTSYTYDGLNRLKKAETVKGGVRTTAEYIYNGDDLRVSKTVKKSNAGYQPEVTKYLYDRQNVILETDGSNNIKASYVKGINYISKTDASNKEVNFLFNGHGDVVQTVDEAGTVLNQYDYDIWGNPVLTIETVENAIRYAGEYLDAETGLYYLRARYYDPYIGRFITEDSYWGEDKNPLSLNLYTYCFNDPLRYTDPTGHWPKFLDDIWNSLKEQAKKFAEAAKKFAEEAAAKAKALLEKTLAELKAKLEEEAKKKAAEEAKKKAAEEAKKKAAEEAKKKAKDSVDSQTKGNNIFNYDDEYDDQYDKNYQDGRSMRGSDAKKREKKQVDDAFGKRGSKEREQQSEDLHDAKKGGKNDKNKSWDDLRKGTYWIEGTLAVFATIGTVLEKVGERAVTFASSPIIMFKWQLDLLTPFDKRKKENEIT